MTTGEITMAKLKLVQPAASPLAGLVDDYVNHCRAAGLSEATMKGSYELSLRKVLLPWCEQHGFESVADLDARAFDAFNADLLNRTTFKGTNISKETVRTYIRPVRQFLTWAAQLGEPVKAKPALPRVRRAHRDVLNSDEIDQLEAAANGERNKLMIRILADCGLRIGELARLRVRDIVRSSNRGFFSVRGKGDRDRRVPVAPRLLVRVTRFASSLPSDASTDNLFLSSRRNSFGEWTPLNRDACRQCSSVDSRARAVRKARPCAPLPPFLDDRDASPRHESDSTFTDCRRVARGDRAALSTSRRDRCIRRLASCDVQRCVSSLTHVLKRSLVAQQRVDLINRRLLCQRFRNLDDRCDLKRPSIQGSGDCWHAEARLTR